MLCRDSHTSFWLSLLLSCLFYMLLNHVLVASARLCFLYAHLHWMWVSIDFGGAMILFCALCIQYKYSYLCKSRGASPVSLEHSSAHIIISFILVAHRILGLVGSIDIIWLLASFGIFVCSFTWFALCYVLVAYHSFAIFGPQYSLSSSKYLPLDMCIAFHSLFERYTIYGGTLFILAF